METSVPLDTGSQTDPVITNGEANTALSVGVFDARAFGGQAGASFISNNLGFPTGISGQALTSGLGRAEQAL